MSCKVWYGIGEVGRKVVIERRETLIQWNILLITKSLSRIT